MKWMKQNIFYKYQQWSDIINYFDQIPTDYNYFIIL